MDWKYVKTISESELLKAENKLNIKLSTKLREVILNYNNGRPERNCFNTKTEQCKTIKKLLSYNKDDKDNVYIFSDLTEKGYIPFAITEFGDVVCEYKQQTIYLYKHELEEFEYLSTNIEEFINTKLY